GIISKPSDVRYLAGVRRGWIKVKCRNRQEFTICGYTPPAGTGTGFGALVLGTCENGKMVSRGKVGTGFTEKEKSRLLGKFRPLERETPPFRMSGPVQWLEPELVAEVEFAEITREGSIRQGSYVSLREDKQPAEVRLEGVREAGGRKGEIVVGGIGITHPDRLVYPDDMVS